LSTARSLPPSAAIPALHALDAPAEALTPFDQWEADEELAWTLHDDGDCFQVIVNTLAVMPRPACTLRDSDAAVALDALAASPLGVLARIWKLLLDARSQSVPGDRDVLLTDVAAPGWAVTLTQTPCAWMNDDGDPRPLLALRMPIENATERWGWGAMMLTQQPDMAASLLLLLNANVRSLLACAPESPTPALICRRHAILRPHDGKTIIRLRALCGERRSARCCIRAVQRGQCPSPDVCTVR